MHIRAICIAGLLAALCGGCASEVPFDRSVVATRISEDLRIPVDSVNVVGQCTWLVVQSVEQKPPLRPCLYVATPGRALLVDYDEAARRYRDFASFDATSVRQIGFATFGRARQVQAYTSAGIYGFEVDSHGVVDQAASREAYEHLKAMGIPQLEKAPYVRGALQLHGKGPMIIYIPASR